jgi:hypothetical protein
LFWLFTYADGMLPGSSPSAGRVLVIGPVCVQEEAPERSRLSCNAVLCRFRLGPVLKHRVKHLWLQVPSMEWCFGPNNASDPSPFKTCKLLLRAAGLYAKVANKAPFFRQDPSTQPRGPLKLEFFGRPQEEAGAAAQGAADAAAPGQNAPPDENDPPAAQNDAQQQAPIPAPQGVAPRPLM